MLAPECKVTLDGKDATLADSQTIEAGASVQLTFSVDDDKKLAHIQHGVRIRGE